MTDLPRFWVFAAEATRGGVIHVRQEAVSVDWLRAVPHELAFMLEQKVTESFRYRFGFDPQLAHWQCYEEVRDGV